MKYRALILVNKNTKVDVARSLKEYEAYLKTKTPYTEVQFDTKSVDIPIVYVPISELPTEKGVQMAYGVKDVPFLLEKYVDMTQPYHAVIFIHKKANPLWVANWTNTGLSLYGETYFTQCVTSEKWPASDLLRVLSHEFYHVECARANQEGFSVEDSMDRYDKEYEIDAPDGNRVRVNNALQPYWTLKKGKDVVMSEAQKVKILTAIKSAATQVIPKLMKLLSRKTKLDQFAEAIQTFEGFAPNTRAYRNNNPGNFRFTPYIKSLGALKDDGDDYAVFPDYDTGYEALKQFIRDAANGLLAPYNTHANALGKQAGGLTIYEFFSVYAPSGDNNNVQSYAEYVARRLGVPVTSTLTSLI